MERGDDHQGNLRHEEDGDDDDRHDGDSEGVSPLHLLSLVVATLTRVETSEIYKRKNVIKRVQIMAC